MEKIKEVLSLDNPLNPLELYFLDVVAGLRKELKEIKEILAKQNTEIQELKTKNEVVEEMKYKKYFISLWMEGSRIVKFDEIFTDFFKAKEEFEKFDLKKYPNGIELKIEETI
jgi:hypothetical protein